MEVNWTKINSRFTKRIITVLIESIDLHLLNENALLFLCTPQLLYCVAMN